MQSNSSVEFCVLTDGSIDTLSRNCCGHSWWWNYSIWMNVQFQKINQSIFSKSCTAWFRIGCLLSSCRHQARHIWKSVWWKLHAAKVCMEKQPAPRAVWPQCIASLSSGPALAPRRGYVHPRSWPNHHHRRQSLWLKLSCHRNSTRHLLCLRPRNCLIGPRSTCTNLLRPKCPSRPRHLLHHHPLRLPCRLQFRLRKPYCLSQGSDRQGYFSSCLLLRCLLPERGVCLWCWKQIWMGFLKKDDSCKVIRRKDERVCSRT